MDNPKTILVVEDESDLREILCYNLEKEGYTCHAVADGGKAVDEIRRNPPDLIILDRMLPSRSGDDVATVVQRDPRTAAIPIIMLTAKAEESDQLVGFALGAVDYITKPFSMKVLLARGRECRAGDPRMGRLGSARSCPRSFRRSRTLRRRPCTGGG